MLAAVNQRPECDGSSFPTPSSLSSIHKNSLYSTEVIRKHTHPSGKGQPFLLYHRVPPLPSSSKKPSSVISFTCEPEDHTHFHASVVTLTIQIKMTSVPMSAKLEKQGWTDLCNSLLDSSSMFSFLILYLGPLCPLPPRRKKVASRQQQAKGYKKLGLRRHSL